MCIIYVLCICLDVIFYDIVVCLFCLIFKDVFTFIRIILDEVSPYVPGWIEVLPTFSQVVGFKMYVSETDHTCIFVAIPRKMSFADFFL